jgi:hypothetical protein
VRCSAYPTADRARATDTSDIHNEVSRIQAQSEGAQTTARKGGSDSGSASQDQSSVPPLIAALGLGPWDFEIGGTIRTR